MDSSALIEFLRATGSAEHLELRRLISTGASLATTDPVVMEVLAGPSDEARVGRLRRFLLGFSHIPIESLADYERASAIYRRCRRAGETPRSLVDCLIAAVALREAVPVLARDRDFEMFSRVVGLQRQPTG